MKTALLVACTAAAASSMAQTSFTAGSISVLRVGNGATTLTNASALNTIVEYTPTGTAGFSVVLPPTNAGGAPRLTNSGSASSGGLMTLSADGTKLVIPGYDADSATASVNGSSVDRVVNFVDNAGTVSRAGAGTSNNTFTSDNIRSAVSDGSGSSPNVYASGNAGSGNSGVRLLPAASGTSTGISMTNVTNVRGLGLFNGNLYYSTASGTQGIYQLGTGLPSGTTTATAVVTANNMSPYGFFISRSGDSVFIADDRALSSGGGILFYSRAAGTSTFSLKFTISPSTTTGQTAGARGLTGLYSNGILTLFATTTETSNNRFIRVEPGATAATSTVTLLASAGANYVFRGVAPSPSASTNLPLTLLSFAAQRQGTIVKAAWTTSDESNVSHMEFQRSLDGTRFESLEALKAGNTPGEHRYEATDAMPPSVRIYYRVASVDLDGTVCYGRTVMLGGKATTEANTLRVTPNPVERSFSLLHAAAVPGARVVVSSLDGRMVAVRQPDAGSTVTDMSAVELPTGTYIATFENNGTKAVARFVK